MTKSPENEHLPKHVAIIMDGNGRWAKQRGLPRGEGHKQGAKVFKRICEYAADRGIRYVTFYAFSTENWRRPPEEVSGIMDLFREYLREAEEREQENAQKGLRIRYIGEREGLADDILELVDELERGSADKVRTTVNIAINYGGRNEILSACKRLAEQCARGEHGIPEKDLPKIFDSFFQAQNTVAYPVFGQTGTSHASRPGNHRNNKDYILYYDYLHCFHIQLQNSHCLNQILNSKLFQNLAHHHIGT